MTKRDAGHSAPYYRRLIFQTNSSSKINKSLAIPYGLVAVLVVRFAAVLMLTAAFLYVAGIGSELLLCNCEAIIACCADP